MTAQGTVQEFDAEKGVGFIRPDTADAMLFVHCSEVFGAEGLRTGQRVEFEITQSRRGPQASHVIVF
ncbi:cold shock domain-containing protein [Streptomyces sp. NPDC051362]|uniref:cold shock domain-containing protein n=1 Tax=Streptomyces sp. NPDC051362 TaxID=3365651 RepID=UPI00379F4F68